MIRYRPLTLQEQYADPSFIDHFRFSIECRMERDTAIRFAQEIERLAVDRFHGVSVDLRVAEQPHGLGKRRTVLTDD